MTPRTNTPSAIRRGLPITECGLAFYPVTMEHYEEFLACKDALLIRQASLPVRYLTMDYTSALFAIAADAAAAGTGDSAGMFVRLLRLLYLALRIDYRAEEIAKNIFYTTENGVLTLSHIIVVQENSEVMLTPGDISAKIRPIIAAQNGLILPKESYDNELVEADELRKRLGNQIKLKVNSDDLISSVAYLSHVRPKDIDEWTIYEFEARHRAIDRDKRYMLYTQAEMSGMVEFKNGNPAPSWRFDAEEESQLGTISMEKFQGKTLNKISMQ